MIVKDGNKSYMTADKANDYIIPNEYQQVEYLESTGTQYIDTGFKPNNNSSIRLKFKFNSLPNYNQGLYGSYSPGNRFEVLYYSSLANLEFGYADYYNHSIIAADLNEHELFHDKNYFFLDGLKKYQVTMSSFQSDYNMWLFTFSFVGEFNSAYGSFNGNISIAEIYDDGVLVRNLIPALRKSDSKPGLYDTVSKTFYTNQGTGEFLYGSPVSNIKLMEEMN